MKKTLNQQGFHIWVIALIVVVLAGLGFAGWYVWDMNKNQTAEEEQTSITVTPTSISSESNTITYSNSLLGVQFQHPKSWLAPDSDIKAGDVTYFAEFSGTKSDDNDYEGVLIAANDGNQDFSGGTGRGGALWDAVGYTQVDGSYLLVIRYITDSGIYNSTYPVKSAELVKGINTDALIGSFDFFGDEYTFATVNPNTAYYGVMVMSSNSSYVEQILELAETFKLL